MKYSRGRKVFLLGLVFFMILGAFSCKQPKNKEKSQGYKVSWEVEGNGAVGYEVVAKVENKEIKKDSLHPIGTVINFEVKDIPTTHKLVDAGWNASNGILKVDTTDSTKATLTLGLGKSNVDVVITLIIPKYKVSWEVSPNGLAGYEVEAKVGYREIEKNSTYPKGTVISFEVKDIPSTHELMPSGWASSSGKLVVSLSDSTKATLTLGKADAHVSITLRKTYNIGDEGPGGGKVFYVSKEGFYVYDGKGGKELFHYLEMSKDTLGESKWFPKYSIIGTSTGLGYGKENTYKILNASTSTGLTKKNCAAYRTSKYSTASTKAGEWWLPSKDELSLIYKNQKNAVLATCTDKWHWSSSEDGNYHAWVQNFGSGVWIGNVKDSYSHSVRGVRAF